MSQTEKPQIDKFKPQRVNANKHNLRGMKALDDSIVQDGWIGAITTAADGETFDGSARLETLQNGEGADPIVVEIDGTRPVILKRLDIANADDPKAQRLAIAANRVAELNLDWDADILAELSQEINLTGLWSDEELSNLLAFQESGEGCGEEDEEEVSALIDEAESGAIESRVSLGQIWKLGRHYLACGDSTSELNIRNLIAIAGCKTPSFVFCDPPYGVEIVASSGFVGGGEAYDIPFGGVKNRKGYVGGGNCNRTSIEECRDKKAKGLGTIGGSKPFGSSPVRGSVGASNIVKVNKYAPIIGDDSIETAVQAYQSAVAIAPTAMHVWWGGNYYASTLPDSSCWIVWDKENTGNFADAELAWTNSPTATRIFKHMWNGMVKASEHGQKRVHPTQKPIALAEWCFEKYGKPDDVILDQFLGSGMSLIAAQQMEGTRSVIGFELSEEYCEVICRRFESLTGINAELVGSLTNG